MNSKKLTIGDFGDGVANLHDNLKKHGFNVSAAEVKRKFFGPTTREAVGEFQKINRIEPSCEVCDKTASLLVAYPLRPADEAAAASAEKGGTERLIKTAVTDDDVIAEAKKLNPEAPDIKSTDGDVRPDAGIEHNPQDFSILDAPNKKRLDCLKRCQGGKKANEKLEDLFRKAKGDVPQFKKLLEESADFDEAAIRKLDFANDLADLTGDDETLVDVFLSHNKTNCLRDVALNLKKEEFKSIIGKTAEAEEKEKKASELHDRLFRMTPTAVIERMTRDDEMEMEDSVKKGMVAFFESHPDLDFNKDSVLKALDKPETLKKIPASCREEVVHSLKCCQRLAAICPSAEAVPNLMKAGLNSAYAISELPMERFVTLYGKQLGNEAVAKSIHSRAKMIVDRNTHALVALRDAVLSPSVNMVHGGQSSAARMESAIAVAEQKGIPINFETLFGSVDLCECKHCNSVYSPAAYLVELFQYLRNNNLDSHASGMVAIKANPKDISGTPLKSFFNRRPDLGHLQLTCENTNTLIPYIDLVNEVMESFVVNLKDYEQDTQRPRHAKINTYNVEDESSGELLAEAQHTNYRAYKILKDAVYPVCRLPYHQPIDATRQYLNFLKTSRYELFSTFRKDISFEPEENASDKEKERLARKEVLEIQSVDSAIAAEYLFLTEEEYVILTKEGFHTKEWYELERQTKLTQAKYHEEIGLKNTWDYYGIDSKNQMLSELKWVKPAQETGVVGFLRRVNIQYVDLIELLKTRYINPNYLSGRALAYMNSLRYSYRYLQTLVDQNQTDIKLKYQQVVQLLQDHWVQNRDDRFDKNYIECWVYKYFAKIGKLIVLENASSAASCKCIEGTILIFGGGNWEHAGLSVALNFKKELTITVDCQIYIKGSSPKIPVGNLDKSTGKLILDFAKILEPDTKPWAKNPELLEKISEDIINNLGGRFKGINGETGRISLTWDFTEKKLVLVLYVEDKPFTCTDSIEHKDTCDISKTQLKHLDGTDLVTDEYDRLHRFIRLWCKLDWSIAEVDLAITGVGETANNPFFGLKNILVNNHFKAFEPPLSPEEDDDGDILSVKLSANLPDTSPNLSKSRLTATLPGVDPDPDPQGNKLRANSPTIKPEKDCKPEPISQVLQEITPYLIDQLVAVKKLQEITGLALEKLLVYWTSIGTQGEKSLYEQLFLKYNLIAEDQIFQREADAGTYLIHNSEDGEKGSLPSIKNHLPVIMAALKVDVAMLEKIMAYAGIADKLTLAVNGQQN